MSKAVEELENLEDKSAADLEKDIAAAAKPLEPEKKEDSQQEFSHTAGDGTVYKAASMDELLKKVAAGLDNTKNALKDREHQIHELRTRTATLEPKKEEPKFDQQTWINLASSDATKADEYIRQFNSEAREVREFIDRQKAKENLEKEVAQFYQAVPTYAQMETPEVNGLMKTRMQEKGRSYTADSLKLTYMELRDEGAIKEPNGEPLKRKTPPPASPGSATSSVEDGAVDDFENMSAKEMEAHFKKNKIRGAEYLK